VAGQIPFPAGRTLLQTESTALWVDSGMSDDRKILKAAVAAIVALLREWVRCSIPDHLIAR
jgi:hypothetical protein